MDWNTIVFSFWYILALICLILMVFSPNPLFSASLFFCAVFCFSFGWWFLLTAEEKEGE